MNPEMIAVTATMGARHVATVTNVVVELNAHRVHSV
jgi:hypothetical protein